MGRKTEARSQKPEESTQIIKFGLLASGFWLQASGFQLPQRQRMLGEMFRAAVFDMDGLMIDSEKIYWAVGRQIAQEFGKTVSDRTLGRMMGRSPLDSVAIYAQDLGLTQSPRELLEMREARVQRRLEQGVDPMPGLMQALDQLKPHYKLAIATSAKMYLVKIVLSQLKLASYFDAVQTSDEIVHGKPDPEIYLRVIQKLGVMPAETVVLEDSSNGALAGKRAGGYVIAVPSQYTRDQDFSFADYVAGDLRDAATHIAQKPPQAREVFPT